MTQLAFLSGEPDSRREVGDLQRLGIIRFGTDSYCFHIAFDATDDLAVGSY